MLSGGFFSAYFFCSGPPPSQGSTNELGDSSFPLLHPMIHFQNNFLSIINNTFFFFKIILFCATCKIAAESVLWTVVDLWCLLFSLSLSPLPHFIVMWIQGIVSVKRAFIHTSEEADIRLDGFI